MAFLSQITDNIYAHTEGKTIGNVGAIITDDGNYIVDTSMFPVMARDIRVEIEQLKTGQLNGALLTHYHFDHSGGNQIFHDVGIHSHKFTLENMKNNYDEEEMKSMVDNREDAHLFEEFQLTYPTIIFETNPYHPEESEQIEIYQVGGHTKGSSFIFWKAENVVFAGDNLFAGSFPWGGDPTASPYDWKNATEFLIEQKPDIIIPGHGQVQHNLNEVEFLHDYLSKTIELGEQLTRENLDSDSALEQLLEIDSKPVKNEEMKERTLKHWYSLMNNT